MEPSTTASAATASSGAAAAISVVKMTVPTTVGTLLQVAFLPRTGLNRDWIPHQQSPIPYYQAKGRLLARFHPRAAIEVPPTTSVRLVSGLLRTAHHIGWAEYYRQLWPSGRLLIAGNLARYSLQIGLNELQPPSSATLSATQKLGIRVAMASCVEYVINGPFAKPYTAGAAKITPDFLLAQAAARRHPLPIPVGSLKPAPGGIPRFVLKGVQVGVQFSVADQTRTWLPPSFRENFPITNAFLSGVLARSMVEVATVPLRNAANFRNIGFSTAESTFKVHSFPLLSSGINVLAKGLSFGMVLGLNKAIASVTEPSG